MSNRSLHDLDFHAWTNEQSGLLHGGRPTEADIAHIADEIEGLRRGERRALAVLDAVAETGLSKSSFPPTCPWDYDRVMDADFWPEETR